MSECEHKQPIRIEMYPDTLHPDHQPYENDDTYVEVETIYDYNIIIRGHYCPDCETLLDVDCDGE